MVQAMISLHSLQLKVDIRYLENILPHFAVLQFFEFLVFFSHKSSLVAL